MIVFFGNCILGSKPQILLRIHRITEASSCKARRWTYSVLCMPCKTPAPLKSWISSRVSVPSAAVNTSSALPGPGYADLGIFVYITVSMTCQRDGLFPVADAGNGCHLPESVHGTRCRPEWSGSCRWDSSTSSLNRYSSILAALGVIVAHLTATPYFKVALAAVNRHLIICFVAMLQTEVIILCLQSQYKEAEAHP